MQPIQLSADEVIQELIKQHVEETSRLRHQLAMSIVEARTWKRAHDYLRDAQMDSDQFEFGAEGTED